MSRNDQENVHARKHLPGPMESCWECARQRARCKDKRPFADPTDAKVEALRINVAQGYDPRVTVYRCGWCGHVHLTSHPSARAKKRWALRAEKTRRQALIAAVEREAS